MAQYFDLHIHSVNSFDSSIGVRRIFDKAYDLGLRGVAITDHNELTIAESPYSEVLSIPGMEINIESIHADLIALGITKPISRRLSLKDTVDEIHKQGGVVIVPHPISSSTNYPAIGERIYEIKQMIDGIDITSPKSHVNNLRARKLAEDFRVAKMGSSDAHSEKDIGRAVTVIQRPVSTVKELLDQIRMRRTKAKLIR
ncbi:MAG: PHP-associated domain-containing protein [Candidatus Kariarchaeaceae archaeon]|jgi:predicted metal-dependent phosphoesterase TrpH